MVSFSNSQWKERFFKNLALYQKTNIIHFSNDASLYKQSFFATQPKCCLTFSRIELEMLLGCCLIHLAIIMLKHILYLVYLGPCLGLGLFMLHLCNLFFIFSLIFIIINHITSFRQTHLFFVYFFCISRIILG